MHRRPLLAVAALAVLTLSACTQQAKDELARDAARSAITPVLVERFPGVPLDTALDCVLDNASSAQIYALAADSVTGPTASTVQIVTDIASKQETKSCLAGNVLSALIR